MSADLKKELEDKAIEKVKQAPMLEAKSTPPFKLKDRAGRGGVEFNLLEVFGFVPDKIVIQKVAGRNNWIVVSAILTERELEKEQKKNDKAGKKGKAVDQGQSKVN